MMRNYIPSQQEIFVQPIKPADGSGTDHEGRRINKADPSRKQYKSKNISVFVREINLHVFVVKVRLSLGDRLIQSLN